MIWKEDFEAAIGEDFLERWDSGDVWIVMGVWDGIISDHEPMWTAFNIYQALKIIGNYVSTNTVPDAALEELKRMELDEEIIEVQGFFGGNCFVAVNVSTLNQLKKMRQKQ